VGDRDVHDLAEAVIDGESIDWPAAKARLSTSDHYGLAAELETLSQLTTDRTIDARPETRRLPALLEAARWLAIVSTAVGLVGQLLALQRVAVARIGIITLVLLIFAAVSVALDVGARDRRTRALASCYWGIAAAFSASGLAWLAREGFDVWGLGLLAATRPEAFFPASLWQFARDFPRVTRFGPIDRVCLAALTATLVLGTLLFIANLVPVVAPTSTLDRWVSSFQRMREGSLFWTTAFAAAIPALAVIWWRGRSASGQEGTRVKIFLYGVAFSVLPVFVAVLGENLIAPLARVMRTPLGRTLGAWFVYTPMFALPAATAYAVAVDNVLDVRVVIQRGIRYVLARWLVMWGAVVPLVLLVRYLYRHSTRPLEDVLTDRTARVLMAVDAIAIVLLLCRQRLVRLLDRWALPGVDDPSAVLAHMTERMKQTRTPLEIATVLARASERALQSPAHVYVMRERQLMPALSDTPAAPSPSLMTVVLEGSCEPCVVGARYGQSYFGLMSEQDRAWINEHSVAVLVPILWGRSGGGGLAGMIALRDRRNALAFSEDDLRFLRAGAASASLACDVVRTEMRASHSPAVLEEVGIQCMRCGRVDAWAATDRICACGHHRWEPAVLPARLFDRFDIAQRLGAGGMGVVYRAVDTNLGRDIAIKTLTRLSEGAASRLRLEARTMAGLAHAHIAVLYGAEVWRGTPLLLMEYLAGGTLTTRLRRGPLSPDAAVRLMRQLISALEHMHGAGQYHGDIKPSNIGFTADGSAKFLDFGLSQAIRDDEDAAEPRTGNPVAAGTLAYMSPEVLEGTSPGPALDVWALCLVFYECLTGVNPCLQARTAADVKRCLQDASTTLPGATTPALRRLMERAFADRSIRHPTTSAEFTEGLASIERELLSTL
jgi:hypothetical protein